MEAFVNKIVIDMAAQTPSSVSLVIAGFLSLFLVWMAHTAGVCWRQIWSDMERKIVWSSLIWGVLLVAVILVSVAVLMTLRAYFILADTSADLNIFDTVKGITALSWRFIYRAFAVPEALTIGGLNLLALLFAFLFAFLSHDSDKEYDRRYRQMKKTRKLLDASIKNYEEALKGIHGKYERPLGRALRTFVANGGASQQLPPDNFRQQRHDAERDIPPDVESPQGEREEAEPAVRKGEGPRLVTPVAKAAGGSANPW